MGCGSVGLEIRYLRILKGGEKPMELAGVCYIFVCSMNRLSHAPKSLREHAYRASGVGLTEADSEVQGTRGKEH